MSFFYKTNISSKIIGIIDIGSHKIRVSICKFKNGKATLIGYGEKRQEILCLLNGECNDITLLSENIKIALKKAENNAKKKIKNIIINFPFSGIYYYLKKINYRRKEKNIPINKEELKKILSKSENLSLKRSLNNIKLKYGYSANELKLIIGNIVNFQIEKENKKTIFKKTGENISISLLNLFVEVDKFNTINHIGNIINKKILKIIPSEYSIAKIFPEKDIIIINIGAINTCITIKKDGIIIGISKIGIGIYDLINQISKDTKNTKINIINNINSEIYDKQRKRFLSIWGEALSIGIKEIVKNNICPYKITILGGGKNEFIKNYIKKINLLKKDIKIIKKVELIEFKNNKLKQNIENYDIIRKKITLDSLSMIVETLNLLEKENDIISTILKKVVKNIDFNNY